MFAGLSLDQAPPFEAPLKYFFLACLFAIAAGIAVLFWDISALQPHSPKTVALLHTVTIGFIIMVMFGSLLQMLPVVAGAVIPRTLFVANTTFYLLTLGAALFSLGLYFYDQTMLFAASLLLLVGLGIFAIVSLVQVIKVKNKTPIVWAIMLSLLFFIAAFLLGVHLSISHALAKIGAMHYTFVSIHYNFIFFGWIFLLIAAITFQVVPMFWVTQSFSKKEQSVIIGTVTVSLLFYFINKLTSLNLDIIYQAVISAAILYYVFITLKKLKSRKRKIKDHTVTYWYIALVFLALGIAYWFLMNFFDLPQSVLALLLGLGFVLSLINGMLYKIVPFLTWFHLSSKGIFDIPTMKEMMNDTFVTIQTYLHVAAVLLAIIALGFKISIILKLAATLFILSNIVLLYNLYSAAKIYMEKKEPKKV